MAADGLYFSSEVVGNFAETLDGGSSSSPRELAASLLRALTPWRSSRSAPPISDFRVLGIALSESTGEAFVGSNLEFPGHPIAITGEWGRGGRGGEVYARGEREGETGQTQRRTAHTAPKPVHAEQFAIANMMGRAIRNDSGGCSLPEISHIALAVTPCGHCRQMLQELSSAPELEVVLIANEHGEGAAEVEIEKENDAKSEEGASLFEVHPLRNLLPLAFGPHSVGLLRSDCIPLHVEEARSELPRGLQRACGTGVAGGGNAEGESLLRRKRMPSLACATPLFSSTMHLSLPSSARDLGDMAVAAAGMSYAPYTGSHSGAAVITRDGVIGAGAYLESAAFNPSIPPLHAALIDLMSRRGHSCAEAAGGEICEAFLCESPDAPVRHAASARALLSAVAPGVELQVVEPWFE